MAMAASEAMRSLRLFACSARSALKPDTVMKQLALRSSRGFATVAEQPAQTAGSATGNTELSRPSTSTSTTTTTTAWSPPPPVPVTLYSFPSIRPLKIVEYKPEHLQLPLRKDLLHRAVVYEGDKTRSGTASSKWRGDVRGSGRKLAPQKGTGRARVGDKKSPIRRGGGVAHGPHPRDFSTGLPRKIYDKAWRTALSYRYSCGHILLVDSIRIPDGTTPHFWHSFFDSNGWGKGKGRCTLITLNKESQLFSTVKKVGQHAKIMDHSDVDVKDLLMTGKLIIEKDALDKILRDHSKDLNTRVPKAKYPKGLYAISPGQ